MERWMGLNTYGLKALGKARFRLRFKLKDEARENGHNLFWRQIRESIF